MRATTLDSITDFAVNGDKITTYNRHRPRGVAGTLWERLKDQDTRPYSERYPYTEPANPTYDDGTEIMAGDPIHMTRGGGLLPGYTAEGVAEYGTGNKSTVLYLRQEKCSTWGRPATAYVSHIHMNHGDSSFVKLASVPEHSSFGNTPWVKGAL